MQKFILNKVVNFLHSTYPAASIGVGGSVAVGTYRVDSDIDIMFQRGNCQKSFLLSFYCDGIKVSIFSFSKELFLLNERKYLLAFHSMPITFISGVTILYDDFGFISELKEIVGGLVERRKILRFVLIDELKANIETQLQLKPISYIDVKKQIYSVIDMIIFIFYLKFHAARIIQKQERRNPYIVIKEDDYILYEKLQECLPYKFKTYDQVVNLFENYIQKFY